MNPKTAICCFLLVAMSHAGTSYAARVEHGCDAAKYIPCPSFRTSRTIREHTPVANLSGFTRSKGKWTITVDYGPEEKCAIVSLFVDMGPLDFDREYERVFMNGGGAISDSGTFIHKIDDVESALGIHNSTCRVPAPESQKSDAESKERQTLEEERERLALEEERERLALEEERERLALEEEQNRLEEEQRLARERRRRQGEREQERLTEQRRREEERATQKLVQEMEELARRNAEQRREQERRIAQQQREQEQKKLRAQRRSRANAAAVMGFVGGVLHGLAGGSGSPGFGGFTGSPSYDGGGDQSCEQAKQRVERTLASQNRNSATGGICAQHRRYLQVLQYVRREVANAGCPAHAVRAYDQTIAQTRQGVRAACR